jgi:hypothetical protein
VNGPVALRRRYPHFTPKIACKRSCMAAIISGSKDPVGTVYYCIGADNH